MKLSNELLVPALIGLGLFAQSSEINLANNTSILLILFLLLQDEDEGCGCGCGCRPGHGRRGLGAAAALFGEEDLGRHGHHHDNHRRRFERQVERHLERIERCVCQGHHRGDDRNDLI